MQRNYFKFTRDLAGAASYDDMLDLPPGCRHITISIILGAIGGTTPSIVISIKHPGSASGQPVIQTTGILTSIASFYYSIPYPPQALFITYVLAGTTPTATVAVVGVIFSD